MTKRLSVSVFVKLAVIMTALVAVLMTIVGAFFWSYLGPDMMRSQQRLVDAFARAFVATSPDAETARRVCATLDLQIRYEGPHGAWTTADDLPTIEEVRQDRQRPMPIAGPG